MIVMEQTPCPVCDAVAGKPCWWTKGRHPRLHPERFEFHYTGRRVGRSASPVTVRYVEPTPVVPDPARQRALLDEERWFGRH